MKKNRYSTIDEYLICYVSDDNHILMILIWIWRRWFFSNCSKEVCVIDSVVNYISSFPVSPVWKARSSVLFFKADNFPLENIILLIIEDYNWIWFRGTEKRIIFQNSKKKYRYHYIFFVRSKRLLRKVFRIIHRLNHSREWHPSKLLELVHSIQCLWSVGSVW